MAKTVQRIKKKEKKNQVMMHFRVKMINIMV